MNVTAILEEYFILRRGMSISSVLGKDPTASRVPSCDFSGDMALLVDVGTCIQELPIEYRDVIRERWDVWLDLDDAHNAVVRWSSKAASSLDANKRGARKRARRQKKDYIDKVDDLTIQLRVIDRGRQYINAVSRLKADIEERDQKARAVYGDRAGFSWA